jgi:hypothetical protein
MFWALKSFPLQVVVKDYAVPVEKVTAIRMRRMCERHVLVLLHRQIYYD